MNDQDLTRAWTTMEPMPDQSRRINKRVFEWIEAHDTPIAAEWIGLVTVNPFAALGLVTVSVLSIATATPILWFARSLM